MSSLDVTNISGGLLVCDLSGGNTLRLNNRQSKSIKDSEITPHLKHLESKGLILIESKPTRKSAVVDSKEKEE